MSLHQLNVPFNNASTWNSLGAGVSLGTEAVATPEFSLLPNIQGDYAIFDVSDSITAFAAAAALGQNLNNGWLINPSGTDGWRFRSSEFGTIGDRPILSITYAVPEPASFTISAGEPGFAGRKHARRLVCCRHKRRH